MWRWEQRQRPLPVCQDLVTSCSRVLSIFQETEHLEFVLDQERGLRIYSLRWSRLLTTYVFLTVASIYGVMTISKHRSLKGFLLLELLLRWLRSTMWKCQSWRLLHASSTMNWLQRKLFWSWWTFLRSVIVLFACFLPNTFCAISCIYFFQKFKKTCSRFWMIKLSSLNLNKRNSWNILVNQKNPKVLFIYGSLSIRSLILDDILSLNEPKEHS